MLEALFLSEHFFDPTFRGCLIKSPLEFVTGTLRQLDIPMTWENARCSLGLGVDMNLTLASPPNVKGWSGYRSWIDSSTLGKRTLGFSSVLASGGVVPCGDKSIRWPDEEVMAWAKRFDSYSQTIVDFTNELLQRLIVFPFASTDVDSFLARLGYSAATPWNSLDDTLRVGVIRTVLNAALLLPHYQLM